MLFAVLPYSYIKALIEIGQLISWVGMENAQVETYVCHIQLSIIILIEYIQCCCIILHGIGLIISMLEHLCNKMVAHTNFIAFRGIVLNSKIKCFRILFHCFLVLSLFG